MAAIVLLAVNMRSPLIAFGVVAHWIQAELGLSADKIGLIGAMPMIAFALSSMIAPKIAGKFGLVPTLLMAAILLFIGVAGRVLLVDGVFATWVFVVGTAVLSVGIAMGNVLVPAVIKRYAEHHIGLTTGIYSMALSLFAGVSALVMVPMALQVGWRWSLGVWSIAALMAVMVWGVIDVKVRHHRFVVPTAQPPIKTASQNNTLVDTVSHRNDTPCDMSCQTDCHRPSLWRSSMAWYISLLLGLQSMLYYTLAGFLPLLLGHRGVEPQRAGQAIFLLQMVTIPATLLLTHWVARGYSIRLLAVAVSVMAVVSVVGFGFLSVTGYWLWLWSVLAGMACAVIFTLSLMMFGWKSANDAETARLSGMAQTVGYGIAFFGPFMMGVLYEWSGGFAVPMMALGAMMVVQCVMAYLATSGQPLYVLDDLPNQKTLFD